MTKLHDSDGKLLRHVRQPEMKDLH